VTQADFEGTTARFIDPVGFSKTAVQRQTVTF
jgi:hypothetical protein